MKVRQRRTLGINEVAPAFDRGQSAADDDGRQWSVGMPVAVAQTQIQTV